MPAQPKRTHVLTLALLVAAMMLGTPWPSIAGESQGEKHWAGSGRRQVEVLNALPAHFDTKVDRVLAEWERSGVVDFLVRPSAQDGCDSLPDAALLLCWRAGLRTDGEATTASYGDHITSALVAIEVEGAKRVRAVLCHEVGHTLGLEHRGSGRTCMKHPIDPENAAPDARDLETLRAGYSHSD
ncbi:MAG: hypothetical protein ACRDH6_04810 [Actinomycetota bacterium]